MMVDRSIDPVCGARLWHTPPEFRRPQQRACLGGGRSVTKTRLNLIAFVDPTKKGSPKKDPTEQLYSRPEGAPNFGCSAVPCLLSRVRIFPATGLPRDSTISCLTRYLPCLHTRSCIFLLRSCWVLPAFFPRACFVARSHNLSSSGRTNKSEAGAAADPKQRNDGRSYSNSVAALERKR